MQYLKIVLIIFLLEAIFSQAKSQEIYTGLNENPVLKEYVKNKNAGTKVSSKKIEAVKLPFREDFSIQSMYPNEKLWASKSVFVNQSYAVNPPSYGVVTFDAMNEHGAVYPNIGSFPSPADTLTSQPIRLDTLFVGSKRLITIADSLYLSFFIQPQGNGSKPLPGDSIILQFFNPVKNFWQNIWAMDGCSLDSFRTQYHTDFLQVMIPINNSDFLDSNFQFRFYNYARTTTANIPSWRSGLYSNWNLDYVVLDVNRNINDTSYKDMSIQTYQMSLLKDYISMPWNQFQAAGSGIMNYGLGIKYKNFDNSPTPKNVDQFFYIYDLVTSAISFQQNPNPSSVNIYSHTTNDFNPIYSSYVFNTTATRYPDFKIVYSIFNNSSPDIFRNNDSLVFYQRFYNYMSYDDGVPEAGYGLSSAGSRLAYQFQLFEPDTIQSIQIYFNQTIGNANQQYFYLTIWDDNNGLPGNVIYEQSGARPEFESNLFQYHTYILNNPVALGTGKFYVGWRQTTKDNLNVGFDFNDNMQTKIFYNTGTAWYNASKPGAIMIRPILGSEKEAYLYISDSKNDELKDDKLKIYPNPNNGSLLNISINENNNLNNLIIKIYNIQGQEMYSNSFTNTINIADFNNGIYIIKVINTKTGTNKTQKLIISK